MKNYEFDSLGLALLILSVIGLVIAITVVVLLFTRFEYETKTVSNFMNMIPEFNHKKFAIYLCCYDDYTENLAKSYSEKHSYFRVHRLKQSVYMENELYFWLSENPDEIKGLEWVGSLASTFETKIKFWSFDKLLSLTDNKDIDLIYFKAERKGINLKDVSSWYHPEIIEIFQKTFSAPEINYEIDSLLSKTDLPIFYCNYWLMRTTHLNQFLIDINKIKKVWRDNFSLTKLLYKNAHYQKEPSTNLAKNFGVSWYTYHCFVLERFPSLFCGQYNLKTWIP